VKLITFPVLFSANIELITTEISFSLSVSVADTLHWRMRLTCVTRNPISLKVSFRCLANTINAVRAEITY